MARSDSSQNSKSQNSSVQRVKKSKKDKKSKKQRRRSHSSSSQQRNRNKKNKDYHRDKIRERQRSYERDKKKNKDKKYNDNQQKRNKERQRSRSKDKLKSNAQIKKSKFQTIKQTAQNKKAVKKSRSKSPSPQNKKNLTEQERQRKLAMRKVKARLLKLNDILDLDKSDSDSSQQMKAPDLKTPQSASIVPTMITNKNMPPPIPPPMPPLIPSNQASAQITVQKPKMKKQSRWGKTSSSQPAIVRVQNNENYLNSLAAKKQQKQAKLGLQPQASQDLKLSLSQDRSIEVQHHHQQGQQLQVIDEQYVDPLDQYMMEIQGQAAAQIQLPNNTKKRVITFQQIVTTQPQPELKKQQKNSYEEDQQKFKELFLNAVQKIGEKQEQDSQNEQGKGQMIENNQDIQSDFQNVEEEKEGELDFFAKQRKMAERKDLGSIDHTNIDYEEVKFNLYREAEQVRNVNYKDVVKYRKQAGDIKVRGKDIVNPVFNWYQCGFSDKILTVIQKRQYSKPFPIQAQTLPLIMSGRDVIGIAETGSGKTLSYLLPALKHIMAQRPVQQGQGPIAIIMTPTRQLARQVYLQAKNFVKSTSIKVLAVYGGLGVQTQLADFKKGAQLVVCTPGRMLDILTLNKGRVTNLKRVSLIIIDQADRMFDLGFQPQITKIIENSRPRKQVVLFSATFPKNVENLARRILVNPCQVIVGSRGQACSNVQQIVVVLEQTSKFLKLLEILGQWNQKGSILIFVDKQNEVDYLFQQLLKYGYHALTLHGAMDHDDRQFTIYDFKKGIKTIMVATSVCARGLDIKAICLVVNFKCPNHLQDYIHRIGRTGRAGTKGTAITFITPEEQQYSIDLLKALQMSQIRPPEDLIKLSQNYLSKVKKGQARKIRNRNLMGSGFKFDEEEQQRVNQAKAAIKKQLKNQGLGGGFEDSDEQDIEMKKKKQENIRGRNQQDRIAQALKNPQIKNKLVSQAVKAVSQAMKSNNRLSTEKILQIAIGSMKQSVTKHKVVTSVEDGVQKVTQLINEFQNKGIQGADFFSYDFQINDYPLNARQKACNQSFLKQVQHQTNCSVSLRGVYVEPGKKVPVGCRKLYLHIQGQNKYYVTTAYKQIKGVLEENAYQSMHAGLAQPGKYTI